MRFFHWISLILLLGVLSVASLARSSSLQLIYDLSHTSREQFKQIGDKKADGYVLRLELQGDESHVMIRLSDTLIEAMPLMHDLRSSLDKDPDKEIHLFIEGSAWESLHWTLAMAGLWQEGKPLPGLSLYALDEGVDTPEWILNFWEIGFELDHSDAVPSIPKHVIRGSAQNQVMLIRLYSHSPFYRETVKEKEESGWSADQFIMNYLIDIWQANGKEVDFLIGEPGNSFGPEAAFYVNQIKEISGEISHNGLPLEYVLWEGTFTAYSRGRFSFPVFHDQDLLLFPSSPGYTVYPEELAHKPGDDHEFMRFSARPMRLEDNLVVNIPFIDSSTVYCKEKRMLSFEGVGFIKDEFRPGVAHFDGQSMVELATADQLGLTDSDFTVSAWIRPAVEKRIHAILGTMHNELRRSLHLNLRQMRPYLGFFGNDQYGQNILDAGAWVHIVWRYYKHTGEQAIFVNGRLDSKSTGHPAYLGKDQLAIGYSFISGGHYFHGDMADFCIWNRALGEEEIELLHRGVNVGLNEADWRGNAHWFILVAVLVLAVFLAVIVYRFIRAKRRQVKDAGNISETARTTRLRLFGELEISNGEGQVLTSMLTPKTREFFLLLLLHQTRYPKGISTEELELKLWPGFTARKSLNNRNVTTHKLREILKEISDIELIFKDKFLVFRYSHGFSCDYQRCLELIHKLSFQDNLSGEEVLEFHDIISKGSLLPDDEYSWLDEYKTAIHQEIVDALLAILLSRKENLMQEENLTLAKTCFSFDPVNEELLQLLMAQLSSSTTAKHFYNRFCTAYQSFYGERYHADFSDLRK